MYSAFVFLLLLAVVLVNMVGAGKHHSHPSDPTRNNNTALDLVFIHMRKSGGTTLLDYLGKWIFEQGCSVDPKPASLGVQGIRNGHPFFRNHSVHPDAPCPGLNIHHNEFSCVNADTVLRHNAPIGARRSKLQVLTMLRHPIRRVISQAFYNGFAVFITKKMVFEMCGVSIDNMGKFVSMCGGLKKRDSFTTNVGGVEHLVNCSCLYSAQKEALASIKANETAWFLWMETVDMIDTYMDNYFIKRLVGSLERFEAIRFFLDPTHTADPALLADLWGPTPRTVPVSGKRNGKLAITTDYDALAEVYSRTCRDVKTMRVTASMLEQAKALLEKHVTVLILEYFGDKASHAMLNTLLGGSTPNKEFVKQNGGVLSQNSTLAAIAADADIMNVEEFALQHMPPSVYAKLVEDNELDIQLFKFAVDLYLKRAAELDLPV